MDWTDGLNAVGSNYYAGIVANVDEVLECHKLQTRSCFGTRSSVTKKLEVQDNADTVNLCLLASLIMLHRYTRIGNT